MVNYTLDEAAEILEKLTSFEELGDDELRKLRYIVGDMALRMNGLVSENKAMHDKLMLSSGN